MSAVPDQYWNGACLPVSKEIGVVDEDNGSGMGGGACGVPPLVDVVWRQGRCFRAVDDATQQW
jgi:hypothetical protein